MDMVSFEDILKAQKKLEGVALKTLCEFSRSASQYLGTEAYLKFENQQRTGSFKIRGAYNKISSLSKGELLRGVSACSAGNHAQGVAYSAKLMGAESHIVMPENAPLSKIEATKHYGAQIHLYGDVVDEAYEHCQQITKENGYTFVHPYLDPLVIAGQGTMGPELLEQVKNLDSVVIGIGGGGLISGTALAIKKINPKVKVYGAVSSAAPGMYNLFKNPEHEIGPESYPTIADGIAIRKPSREIYESYIKPYVDDIVTVTDEELAHAMVFLLERAKAVVEGAGAAGLAAAKKANWNLGSKTAIVLCGGNVDLNLISTVIEKGLSVGGRMARVRVAMSDLPGNLSKLTNIIAESKASVIDVLHNRIGHELALRETLIEFVLSTKNSEQILEIKNKFAQAGARVLED